MRMVKPEAGAATKFSEEMMDSGDGAWYPVVGGAATLAGWGFGIPLGIAGPDGFFALAIPGAFFLFTLFNYWRGTVKMPGRYGEYYQRVIYTHWPKIKDSEAEDLAWPMVKQVYKCSVEGHPGASSNHYSVSCSLCSEREKLIKQLIPNKPSDRSDIETVKRYLEMKKEADQQHAAALKELLP